MYTKYLSPFVIIIACALLLLLTYPYLIPVGMALSVAVLLGPTHQWLLKKQKRLSSGMASGICVIVFFIVFMTPVSFILVKALLSIGSYFSDQGADKLSSVGPEKAQALFAKLDQFMESASQTFGVHIQFEPLQWFRGALAKSGTWLVQSMTSIVSGAPALFLEIFIFILALYYFLAEGELLFLKAAPYFGLPSAKVARIKKSFKASCRSIVLTNVITGGVQAGIIVIGASVAGFSELLLIGSITFLFSFIPVIGAAPVGVLLALIKFSMGENGHGLILIIIAMIAGTIDNVIRPWLLSDNSTLHPLLSFLSIVGGIALMGLPGLFLGPIVMEMSFVLIEAYSS